MKNDEAQPSSEAAREEFFPAVESEVGGIHLISDAPRAGLKTGNYDR